MKKIRILGIAPYTGLKDMMLNIAAEWDNIEFTAYEGDLDNGADIARSLGPEHYDAIISRGGTAHAIRKITNVFVYGIQVSYYDVLSSIKLAQNFNGKFAIVGFPAIADAARMLCEILQYDIRIEAVSSASNACTIIDQLKSEGYSLIVGDVVSTRYSSSIGLTSMLVTSGSESIRAAFDEVIRICQYFSRYKTENTYYKMNQAAREEQLIILDHAGNLLFQTASADKATLEAYAKRMLKSQKSSRLQKAIHTMNGKLYLMTLQSYSSDSQTYYLFNASRMSDNGLNNNTCLRLLNKDDVSGNFFSLFYNNTAHRELRETAEKFSIADFPVLIKGESGTGKDRMAELLYSHSKYCNFPCYIIDCDIATDEDIQNLITGKSSPFTDENTTFYFRHISSLSKELLARLFAYITKNNLHKRNRLLFSVIIDEQNDTQRFKIEQTLKYELDCLSLHLPPLRQRIDDIPSVSNLYINEFNIKHGNQISGIEPEAMSLLQGYHWPQNLRQLKHVLSEACVQTSATYISKETIASLLRKERLADVPSMSANNSVDLNQSLADIIYEIACAVLANENMNRTKTAKRLGISRTTLWRILDQHN